MAKAVCQQGWKYWAPWPFTFRHLLFYYSGLTLRFQTIRSQDISLKPGVRAQNQVTLNAGKLLLKESKSEPITIDHVGALPTKSPFATSTISPLCLLGLTWGGCCLSGRRARGERPAAPPMAPRPNKPEIL